MDMAARGWCPTFTCKSSAVKDQLGIGLVQFDSIKNSSIDDCCIEYSKPRVSCEESIKNYTVLDRHA